MINKPKFKSCFHTETIGNDLFLLSEKDYFVLSGRLYQLIAPLINGQRTVENIIEMLQSQISAAEAYYALMVLQEKGYIVENYDKLPSEETAFWEILNIDPRETTYRFKTTKVAVTAFGKVPLKEFISTLESLNIQVCDQGDIEVVLVDDYLQDNLAAFNQTALRLKRPWMLVKPKGTIIWIGPIFYPEKTGCWNCLAHRLRANRPVETYIQKQKDTKAFCSTPFAALPTTWQTGLNLAATEIAKWIAQGENKQLEGVLVTFDTNLLKTESHVLVRRPQCSCCGKPNNPNRKPAPIVLASRKKTFATDGGHRCFSPEETLQRLEHHISPITGIIHALKQQLPYKSGVIHSYSAGHNFAMMFDDLYFLNKTIRSNSGGKGKTDIQAKVSALGEAIERYSGIFQGDEVRQKNTYKAMGEIAIHPNDCLNFSEEQYKNRRKWNLKSAFNQIIPEPFDEEAEVEWTPVWSLTNQKFKYLPTAYCYYGYPRQQNPYCWANSNGNASGNTLEEAILQGFMELVERDSVALWWYNCVQRPSVDLESFDEPYFQAITNYYQTLHREIWVLDITADLNIPAFAAISRRTDQEIEDIIFGFGAHFDPKIAISRAITEANQILPGVSSIAPDGSTQYRLSEELATDWWKTATLKNQPYIVPDASTKPRVYSDYLQQWRDDLCDDVITCVKIAEKQGMEMLVLDQTRPDIGINIVKVVVPGMRHYWNRFDAGRLYDVPVKLGWLAKPKLESQLNPFPMIM